MSLEIKATPFPCSDLFFVGDARVQLNSNLTNSPQLYLNNDGEHQNSVYDTYCSRVNFLNVNLFDFVRLNNTRSLVATSNKQSRMWLLSRLRCVRKTKVCERPKMKNVFTCRSRPVKQKARERESEAETR